MKRIIIIFVCTIEIILTCEYFLRFFVFGSRKYFVYPPYTKSLFKPQEGIMPGITGTSLFQTNSLGIRGDEIPQGTTYKILVIGGSATESLFIDQSKTWPNLLQKNLNDNKYSKKVWVGNLGKSGLTSRHHVIETRSFLPQLSVNAIILLVGVNDLNERLAQDTTYRPMQIKEILSDDKLYQETFNTYPRSNNGENIIKSSGLYRFFWFTNLYLKAITNKEIIDKAGKFYAERRKNRQNSSKIRNDLPDLSSSLNEYGDNIREIVSYAKNHNIRIILLTQPTLWKKDIPDELNKLLWFGGIGEYQIGRPREYYSVEALASGMQQYNDVLLDICQSTNTECINLASLLQKDTTVFYDDCHYNYNGSQKVASIIADYLLYNLK